jgi:hypothetical protein
MYHEFERFPNGKFGETKDFPRRAAENAIAA